MATLTTDERNPGMRKAQRFSVAGGIDGNKSDQETKGVKFQLLKNCIVDKRLGAVLKKPGSVVETISGTLGVPLGIGEYITTAPGSTIPINRTLLANFAGTEFRQQVANTWSTVQRTAYTNFATSKQSSFAKLGNTMMIAGGLPAKWKGQGTTIDRMGIIPPPAPTIESYDSGTGITLTSGSTYYATAYDSVTGLESDWSEPSLTRVPAIANKSIQVGFPATAQRNYDQIKLYRTLDGGAFPYLVGTFNYSPTFFTHFDTKPDSQLTSKAAKRYDKKVPPTDAYLSAKYANCFWLVDAANPYRLQFSKPYTGSDVDLEYWPQDNYVISNELITGLYVVPGKLLVFHPRGISYVSGYSIDDFVFQSWIPGVGTLMHHSTSSNGAEICFLGEQGFVTIPSVGGKPRHISREIDDALQPLLAASYNANLYVSSAWNPSLRQFIFMVMAQSTNAGVPWEEIGTGDTGQAAAWQIPAGADDVWEDVANLSPVNAMNIRVWGWSPELSDAQENVWHEYTFPFIPNGGVSGEYPVFLFHPFPSNDTGDPQQDKTYLGYWNGTVGKIASLFRRDTNRDNGVLITSEYITGRIVPGNEDGGYKLFHGIGFDNAYQDPTSDALATLKYLIDFDDPHLRSYAGSLITISDSTDLKKFPTMLGRHIHLYCTDTSESQSKILLAEYFIHYRERFRKEGR